MLMASSPHRVLVIDDEPALRLVLSDMLAACGYQSDVAADGAAGLARFREQRYGAVITDMLMPGMSGLEVAAALRTLDAGVQIIMLTGSAPSLSSDQARASGISMLLHKPVALAALKAAVDAACSIA